MHQNEGYHATNYLDDLIGVNNVEDGSMAYNCLSELLHNSGLLENSQKACPHATSKWF